MGMTTATGIAIAGPEAARAADILPPEALEFVALLQRELGPRRREIREGDWRVPEAPKDLRQRRVEITGPVDRKMVINALNSGASVFMADFEDANSPTWANVVDGQGNVKDAVARTISLE